MNKNEQRTELKNSDFLAWRVNNYRRMQKEAEIRKIFASRDRDRNPTHH